MKHVMNLKQQLVERTTRTTRRIISGLVLVVVAFSVYFSFFRPATSDFEIVDQLGGNLFPSAILSVATTDAEIIKPIDTVYVGNPKSLIAIKIKSGRPNSLVRIELPETPFYARSVSTFVLPEAKTEYIVYPDILWRYDALRNNTQAEPISVVANVEMNGKDYGQRMRTFSMRSINECLLGYNQQNADGTTRFVSTRLFFAAYVNEENPLIDKVLREALNTRIVRRFLGYQSKAEGSVDKQV